MFSPFEFKKAIEASGKSVSAIAEKAGVDRSSIHLWMRGLAVPNVNNLQAVANAIDVSMTIFMVSNQERGFNR